MGEFRRWLEVDEEEVSGKVPPRDTNISWEEWSNWDKHFDLFAYDDLIIPENRPLPHRFQPARVRGMIRVFDVPSSGGKYAKVGLRYTGRPEDSVNGGITHIPSEEVSELAERYEGYHLGEVDALWIDPETGLTLKKRETVYYLFHPNRAQKKLLPHKEYRRSLLRAAYDVSPEFGDEFVSTTYRLPKRGTRLVKITR